METTSQIRKKYNVSDRALRKWKTEKDKIETVNNTNLQKAKRMTYNKEMADDLFQWLLETQQCGIPVSGPMIKQQAIITGNVNKNLYFKIFFTKLPFSF